MPENAEKRILAQYGEACIRRAEIALTPYGQDDETSVIDLLSDIHHWCHRHDIDLHYVTAVAQRHFLEESQ